MANNTHRKYELRCPVHGFIPINDWEREIINQPAFQRLRRIRQLAWTDYVYPGAMHTRFEHSLGVMHVATQLFDAIVKRSGDLLKSFYSMSDDDIDRDRQIVRLTALLHDTGHSPFSHAGEELFPLKNDKKPYRHEAYSVAVIEHVLKPIIEDTNFNKYCIQASDITALLEGKPESGKRLFWTNLIDGQMDADRMDYLLRDSLHCGVDYGKYDFPRLLNTIQAIEIRPDRGLQLGISEGGIHAAEALVLARYFMFAQVYFHKTRVAYDYHIQEALREILPNGQFPLPTKETLSQYLEWDDWRVLGLLADKTSGGEHADRLRQRNHYREVYHTPESPTDGDRTSLKLIRKSLGNLVVIDQSSRTSAYKLEASDIRVVSDDGIQRVKLLSDYSSIVKNLNSNPIDMTRLYSIPEKADEARSEIVTLLKEDQ